MPENIPQIEENENIVTPIIDNTKDGANGDGSQSDTKSNQDYAAERLAAKAQKLEAEKAKLEARLRELETAALPEEEQIDVEFQQLAAEKVLKGIDRSKFEKLPKSIQNRIESDPFKFVDQDGLEDAISSGKNKREKYALAAKYAITEIESLVDAESPEPTKQEQADPTISKNGGSEKLSGYTAGELMVLAQTDPEKFERIKNSMNGGK